MGGVVQGWRCFVLLCSQDTVLVRRVKAFPGLLVLPNVTHPEVHTEL